MIPAENPSHRKIIFHDAPWKPLYFADLYRFGEPEAGNRPLLYYIGGASDAERCEERVSTEPLVLVEELKKAMENCGVRDLDFIFSPAPNTTPEQRESRLHDFLNYFLTHIIPQTIGQLPEGSRFRETTTAPFSRPISDFS